MAWDLHCTSARTNPERARGTLPAHRPQAGRLAAQEERKERGALDGLILFTDNGNLQTTNGNFSVHNNGSGSTPDGAWIRRTACGLDDEPS